MLSFFASSAFFHVFMASFAAAWTASRRGSSNANLSCVLKSLPAFRNASAPFRTGSGALEMAPYATSQWVWKFGI